MPNYSSLTPLSSNNGLFNGTSGGLASMSTGYGQFTNSSQYQQNLYNLLGKEYGQGTGQLLGNILEQGLFNPSTAAAFLNAMQPSINQGEQSIMNQFGSEGARFGSSANLGLSNYLGQANLNEQQTLASMYMQAQQEQLQLLEGLLPGIGQERADSGGLHTFANIMNLGANLINFPAGSPVGGNSNFGNMFGQGNNAPSSGNTFPSLGSSGGSTLGGTASPGSDFGTMSSSGLDSFIGGSSGGAALGGASTGGGLDALAALA
jgi:hypothetical protein